jgi:hypothetical protein
MHTAPTTPTPTPNDTGERPLSDTGNRALVTHYLAGDSNAAEAYMSFYSGARCRFH